MDGGHREEKETEEEEKDEGGEAAAHGAVTDGALPLFVFLIVFFVLVFVLVGRRPRGGGNGRKEPEDGGPPGLRPLRPDWPEPAVAQQRPGARRRRGQEPGGAALQRRSGR